MKYGPEILQSPKVLSVLKETESLPKTPIAPRKKAVQTVQFNTPIQRPRMTTSKRSIQAKSGGKDTQVTATKGRKMQKAKGAPAMEAPAIEAPVTYSRSGRAIIRPVQWEADQ